MFSSRKPSFHLVGDEILLLEQHEKVLLAISVGTARGRRRATAGLEESSGATYWYVRHHPCVIPRSTMSTPIAPREDEGMLCSARMPASHARAAGLAGSGV